MLRSIVRRAARGVPFACALVLLSASSAAAAPGPRLGGPAVKDTRQPGVATTARIGRPATARARAELVSALGAGAVVDLDATTGTVRSALKAGGALTRPSGADRAGIVRGWLREHAAALGLTRDDVDGLAASEVTTTPGGLSVLRFRQRVDGIPTFDGGLRAGLDRGGRLLSVAGSPIHALHVATSTPRLSARQAVQALAATVGGTRVPAVRSAATDARRTTTFAGGDVARLVLFGAGARQRLAWHLTYLASAGAWWDAVVDATGGAVLYRQNLVRHAAPASIYPNYPGAGAGGAPTSVDLETLGYLPAGAATLTGPLAHAYSDVDGDNVASPGEEVGRTGSGDFVYPVRNPIVSGHGCDASHVCTWNSSDRASYAANRAQTTVQTFWFNGNWHDHLQAAPIGFDAASGNFEGDDPVRAETDDTIGTAGPELNNANMGTPPDGQSPRMQMYLGAYDVNGDGTIDPADGDGAFRDYNNSDDAATVYHEYTHGLSNRLVTNADGTGALSSAQAGAMGEAWSDWYAFDYLVARQLSPDTATQGEVDIGRYSDAQPHATRFQALDCKVGVPSRCPGGADTGTGGFTYGDFGKVCCSAGNLTPEVHSDGEIWAETLWDLRDALGSEVAEALVTGGMRLSPPEPSFLDERNAILQADTALYGAGHATAIWAVFAHRGMGYFASAADGNDVAPVEDFSTPADAASLPKGTLRGRVTDRDTGKPVAGATVGIGGLSTPGFDGALAATTAADGTYELAGIPQHTYAKVAVNPGGGYFAASLANVAISGGTTTSRDVAVRRTLAAGAHLEATDTTADEYGCGPAGLTDADLGTVWELDLVDAGRSAGYQASATVDLGRPADVYAYGLDPGPGCGSGALAAARQYRLEASADGRTWTTAGSGTLADRGALTELDPRGAAASGVRFVRLTVTADADHVDYGYLDVAELAVFGHTTPAGALAASAATPSAGQAVTLDASSFTTDSRAALTSYAWDLDGDGTVDQTTSTPTTSVTYAGAGTFTPSVTAADDLGGRGSARTTLTVAPGTGPSPGSATATPAAPGRPTVRFLKGRRGGARVRVTCPASCTAQLSAILSRRGARALHRHRRTLARRTVRMRGTRTLELKLSRKTRRALRRRGARSVKVALRVVVRSAASTRTVSHMVRIRP